MKRVSGWWMAVVLAGAVTSARGALLPTDGTATRVDPAEHTFNVVSGMTYAVSFRDLQNRVQWVRLRTPGDLPGSCATATADGTWRVVTLSTGDVRVIQFADDDDNSRAAARLLTVGALPVAGDLKVVGDLDMYKVNLAQGQPYTLLAGDKQYAVVYFTSTGWQCTTHVSSSYTFTSQSNGLVHVYVQSVDSSATGPYNLQIILGSPVPQPDFTISKISLSPDGIASSALALTNVSPGQKLTAYVRVRNIGSAAGNGGSLALFMNMPTNVAPRSAGAAATVAVGTLAAGQERIMMISGLPVPKGLGPKTFRAFVDALGATRESSETNNQLTYPYNVIPPTVDLSIVGAWWSPNVPLAGSAMTLSIVVRNTGTIACDGGNLALWTNRPAVIKAPISGHRNMAVGTVGPLSEKTVTFTGLQAPAAPGPQAFTAFVDSRNTVTNETDEGNNVDSWDFTVGTRYVDLQVIGPFLTPVNPVAGVPCTARLYVSNRGTVPGNLGQVQFWLNRPDDVPFGTRADKTLKGGTLNGGQSKFFTFTGIVAPTAGAYRVRGAVNNGLADACISPPESDRANNQMMLTHYAVAAVLDFAVQWVSFSPLQPAPGSFFTAFVNVKNLGNVAGNAGYLDVWTTDRTGPASASRLVGTLAAATNKTYTITGLRAPAKAGTYDFKAFIDARTSTPEAVEANNVLLAPYSVRTP